MHAQSLSGNVHPYLTLLLTQTHVDIEHDYLIFGMNAILIMKILLTGQVSSIMRRNVFSQLELEEIKSRVSSTTVKPPAIDVSPASFCPLFTNTCCNKWSGTKLRITNCWWFSYLEGRNFITGYINTRHIQVTLAISSASAFKERLCDVNKVLCTIATCTMLLEQIKGFYLGITNIFLLVGSYTMLSWHFLKMLI